jgi:hypothetical protein
MVLFTGGLASGLTPGGLGLSSSISTCGPTALGSPNPIRLVLRLGELPLPDWFFVAIALLFSVLFRSGFH